jgi:hypothetical protein
MTRNDVPYRDTELGTALRTLHVPGHRPEFYAELHQRLAQERVGRLDNARERRLRRTSRRRWSLRVALVAAVAALAFLAYDLFSPGEGPAPSIVVVENATAAEIQAKIEAALASARNLGGVLVSDGPRRRDEVRWRFLLTDAGDFRLTGLNLVENVAYDATTGVQQSLNPSASIGGDQLFAAEQRGIAPGPPDPAPASSILQREFGAFVRALLAAEDPRVQEVTYEGRPAWRLTVDAVPNAIVPDFSGDGFEVTVDRETGLPARVVETQDDAFFREIRIERLTVDRAIAPDAFTIPFPRGTEVMRSDTGFRRAPLAQVRDRVGYAPLVPTWLPAGYEAAEVAVASGGTGAPTGVEGSNPPSTDVVSLSYRRGLDQVLVTTRQRHVRGWPDVWSDPLATGEGYVDEPKRILARRGALSGVELNLLIVPRNIPHVWALTDELVVTVSGDLSRDELVRLTESLRAHP